jgi:uncharacterized protein YbjT (DUF2867 family)
MYIVLGATGHIGSAVTNFLLQRGENVTVITRRPENKAMWEKKVRKWQLYLLSFGFSPASASSLMMMTRITMADDFKTSETPHKGRQQLRNILLS